MALWPLWGGLEAKLVEKDGKAAVCRKRRKSGSLQEEGVRRQFAGKDPYRALCGIKTRTGPAPRLI